jgi:hypothetical protein
MVGAAFAFPLPGAKRPGQFDALCLLWVIRDRCSRSGLPSDVRFDLKATEALLCSEMTRWANSSQPPGLDARKM